MRRIQPIVVLLALLLCAAAWGADGPPPILPSQFAGWQMKDSVTKSTDPSSADATNAPVLREYGFERLESASYIRNDGRKLAVKAAVFNDASGAYGAFTYYKTPIMLNEKIGGQASSLNNRVLFYQGNVLVDAVFDKLSVMSAAELRELASVIPGPAGNARNLPTLPTYLPKESYQKNSAKYILGPVTLDRVGSPLSSPMVDFKSGAEVVIGKYQAKAGDSTLMLIEYPTPQIAAEKLRQIDASHQATKQQSAGSPSLIDVAPFFDKRTGPIIVIASGPLAMSEANSLLGAVSYEADVTWNENTYVTKKDNLANLLFNVIVLCGIVVGVSLVAGLAFGGFRILMKRLFPERVFDRPDDMEIISLHLGDTLEQAARRR
ncbi:MAG TPA: DUF6599 family protein [Terriglobales bacterium]|jgi:hypothetical protein|nr:DUF6599 family protein [Terriglobales bacterium]